MKSFNGNMYHGPYSELLEVMGQVGWHVSIPPWVVDQDGMCHNLLCISRGELRGLLERALIRDGVCHNLLHVSRGELRGLLERAWLSHVAACHRHCKTMVDLSNIDLDLLRLDRHDLSALDSSRSV